MHPCQSYPSDRGAGFPASAVALFALALWVVFSGGLIEEVQGQDSLQTVQTDTVQYGMVKIKVCDKEDQQPVYNAKVRIRDIRTNCILFIGYTDVEGEVCFSKVLEGNYMVLVEGWVRNIQVSTNNTLNEHYFEILSNKKHFIDGGTIIKSSKQSIPDVIQFNRAFPTRLFGP